MNELIISHYGPEKGSVINKDAQMADSVARAQIDQNKYHLATKTYDLTFSVPQTKAKVPAVSNDRS